MTESPSFPRAVVIDLGAGSGRVMLAECRPEAVALRELHRFAQFETVSEGGPAWDLTAIMEGVCEGLACAAAFGPATIGIDSWGLDFGLVDAEGGLTAPVLHYRHPRSARGRARATIAEAELRRLSGGQALPVLTLFQLAEEAAAHPERVAAARTLLPIAALVAWRLTGVVAVERSLARTTGLHDPIRDEWHPRLVAASGIPRALLPPIVEAGTALGPLRPGLPGAGTLGPVLATASHDTAAAVAGLPLGPNDAFLIAGSWNLLGWKLAGGMAAEDLAPALEAGFGCEGGGAGGAFMVQSLNGMHLLRRLREAWRERHGVAPDWSALGAAAEAAPPGAAIAPSDPAFFAPSEIVGATAIATGRPEHDLGGLARAILEGMATEIAESVDRIARLRGRRPARLVVGGGGVRDTTFLRAVRRAAGIPVLRGPAEASATGNALIQFVSSGALPDLVAGHARIPTEALP